MVQTDHAAKLHELPDEYLSDVLPIAKKIAIAQGIENYNILQVRFAALPLTYHVLTMLFLSQNNGRIAHQVCLFVLIFGHGLIKDRW
jgi:hypothetical protein